MSSLPSCRRTALWIWLPKGKQSGGYCTYISEYGAPFIFSNFNGTSGDIDVLTHEAGHAFQVYEQRFRSTGVWVPNL